MLLDRSGQGKVYNLINRRRFQQMDVLEGLNVLVTISGWYTTLPSAVGQEAKRAGDKAKKYCQDLCKSHNKEHLNKMGAKNKSNNEDFFKN